LSIAEQRAVGFIPAWSLAFLQVTLEEEKIVRWAIDDKKD